MPNQLTRIPHRPARVLLLQYSQSGQMDRLMKSFVAPLRDDPSVSLHVESLRPVPAYPFPWPLLDFFDAFPETAHMVPPALAPLGLTGDEDFDLIILPYQVWFLAPAAPITAFLRHPLAERLLRDKPVVTVIACRNMWLIAHRRLCAELATLGARLIDNVVFTDPSPTLATFVTTPAWMLTGRRQFFASLPPAGLTAEQIHGAARFGRALADALREGRERETAPLLAGLGAVRADPRLYVSERAGTRSFYLWGKLLRAVGGPGHWARKPLVLLYALFLIALILSVVPVSLLLQRLLRPLFKKQLNQLQAEFEQPSGSATHRGHVYEG